MLWRIPADTHQTRIGTMLSSAHPDARAFAGRLRTATRVSVSRVFPSWRSGDRGIDPAERGKTMPGSQNKMAERVGFEPTVRLHAQRFSRTSRSTTLAPLRGPAYRRLIPVGQQGQTPDIWPGNQGFRR